jgi:hypothetical protein
VIECLKCQFHESKDHSVYKPVHIICDYMQRVIKIVVYAMYNIPVVVTVAAVV